MRVLFGQINSNWAENRKLYKTLNTYVLIKTEQTTTRLKNATETHHFEDTDKQVH